MILLAEAADAIAANPWVVQGGTLSAMGLLSAVIYWLITKHVPKLTESFQAGIDGAKDGMQQMGERFMTVFEVHATQCKQEKDALLASHREDQREERQARETVTKLFADTVAKMVDSDRKDK